VLRRAVLILVSKAEGVLKALGAFLLNAVKGAKEVASINGENSENGVRLSGASSIAAVEQGVKVTVREGIRGV